MTAKRVVMMGFVLMLAMAAMLSIAFTQDMDEEMSHDHDMMMSKSPIEGTWKMVSSTLPDGTVLKAPQAHGMMSFRDGYRNFNVFTSLPDGKIFSYSVISKYTLTDSTWTETRLYSCMNDPRDTTGIKYTWKAETKTSPVTKDGMKLTVKPPFDPPVLVFDGDKLTATLEGEFVDVWERVK
jgi:hypothetical protein